MKRITAFIIISIGIANAATYVFENSLCKMEFNTFTKKFSVDNSCFANFPLFDAECSISQETALERATKAIKCLNQEQSCMDSLGKSTQTVRFRITKEEGVKIIQAISSLGKPISDYMFSNFSKDINNGIFGNGTNCWINYMLPIKEK